MRSFETPQLTTQLVDRRAYIPLPSACTHPTPLIFTVGGSSLLITIPGGRDWSFWDFIGNLTFACSGCSGINPSP